MSCCVHNYNNGSAVHLHVHVCHVHVHVCLLLDVHGHGHVTVYRDSFVRMGTGVVWVRVECFCVTDCYGLGL